MGAARPPQSLAAVLRASTFERQPSWEPIAHEHPALRGESSQHGAEQEAQGRGARPWHLAGCRAPAGPAACQAAAVDRHTPASGRRRGGSSGRSSGANGGGTSRRLCPCAPAEWQPQDGASGDGHHALSSERANARQAVNGSLASGSARSGSPTAAAGSGGSGCSPGTGSSAPAAYTAACSSGKASGSGTTSGRSTTSSSGSSGGGHAASSSSSRTSPGCCCTCGTRRCGPGSPGSGTGWGAGGSSSGGRHWRTAATRRCTAGRWRSAAAAAAQQLWRQRRCWQEKEEAKNSDCQGQEGSSAGGACRSRAAPRCRGSGCCGSSGSGSRGCSCGRRGSGSTAAATGAAGGTATTAGAASAAAAAAGGPSSHSQPGQGLAEGGHQQAGQVGAALLSFVHSCRMAVVHGCLQFENSSKRSAPARLPTPRLSPHLPRLCRPAAGWLKTERSCCRRFRSTHRRGNWTGS